MKKSLKLKKIAAAALSLTLAAGAASANLGGFFAGNTDNVAYAAGQTDSIITKQPKDVTVYADGNATFSVEADADSYQWYVSKDGGATWVKMRYTTNTCTAAATKAKNGWLFRCVVTKNGTKVTSDIAKLIYAQIITKQPEDVVVCKDGDATFSVEADADSYQWYVSKDGGTTWVKMRYTTNTCTAAATKAKNGWLFRCVVTKNGTKVTSDTAKLIYAQIITKQPEDVTVYADGDATFSVEADADSYQWYVSKDGGATWVKMRYTTNTCTAAATKAKNGWLFRCEVTKNGTKVTSDTAKLIYKTTAQTTTIATQTAPATTTTTTTTTTTPVSNADFTLDLRNPKSPDGAWHVKPGEDAEVDLYIRSTGKPAVGFSVAIESEAKLTDIVKKAIAFSNTSIYADVNTGECNSKTIDASGNGMVAKDGAFIYYTFSTENLAPGVYPITLRKHVILKNSDTAEEYSVNVINGKIIVDG